MITIFLEELEDNLLACLGRIPAGETAVVVDEDQRPVAEVKPLPESGREAKRPFGLATGEFTVPDDFDAPLPEEFLRQFYGQ
jgi:antitoxin (DNA-binding transcriptional repressor) of toxin-antitoxin stability system